MITLALALQLNSVQLGLPEDKRPIDVVYKEAFIASPFVGTTYSVRQSVWMNCQNLRYQIGLQARVKKAKIEGEISTGGKWKILAPEDQKYLDLRLIDIEAEIQKAKIGCGAG